MSAIHNNRLKAFFFFISAFLFSINIDAQKVGVETTTPDSTFSVKNKVEIGGGQGDILFTDDKASITFPQATATNSPMIQMFNAGTANQPRMVVAHSPGFADWGLQYDDTNDQFHFMSAGSKVHSLDLFTGRTAIGKAASINSQFTLHVSSNSEDRSGYFFNDKNTTASTFGMYAGAFGEGSGAKRGGAFDAFGGTGENIGMRATASGGSVNYAVYGSAPGTSNYGGYFNGRGYFSENAGFGAEPTTAYQLRILADGNAYIGSYVKNEYANGAAKYGYYSFLDAQGTGTRYGYYGTVAANGSDNSSSYGIRSSVTSNSTPGTIYGIYSTVGSTGTGNRYGIYSSVGAASNTWAGLFSGKVQIRNGQEASLTQDGFLQIGNTTSSNLVMDNNEITARSNGAEAPLYLQPNQGPVSIGGGTAAGYLLTVDGKIIGEELKIQTSGAWPDYVFADDYNLKSIEEYEASIKANKHLPGIPAAKEVEADGIMVGDMQKRQMEKIEELALYVIQLNNRLKEVELENQNLKSEIEDLKNNK